ncbi:MAG: hypothetical protein AAFY03_03330 [Pseudomonadota bacterium]
MFWKPPAHFFSEFFTGCAAGCRAWKTLQRTENVPNVSWDIVRTRVLADFLRHPNGKAGLGADSRTKTTQATEKIGLSTG